MNLPLIILALIFNAPPCIRVMGASEENMVMAPLMVIAPLELVTRFNPLNGEVER